MKLLDSLDCARLLKIKVIITDVDGVLTDGGIVYTTSGEQVLRFDAQDGAGIRSWCDAGGKFAFLTGRSSAMVAKRALELEINECVMKVRDKRPAFAELLKKFDVTSEEVLYVGDDWPDIPCIIDAGVGVSVGDGVEEVIEIADAVTVKNGGHGAMREIISTLLKVQGKICGLMEKYK